MSTYYYLRCKRCAEVGGFFSRQAGGWGNADIIDTFKFLMAHARCALELKDNVIHRYNKIEVEVISEHDERPEEEEEKWEKHRREPVVMAMFPCSSDWTFMRERVEQTDVKAISEEWLKQYDD